MKTQKYFSKFETLSVRDCAKTILKMPVYQAVNFMADLVIAKGKIFANEVVYLVENAMLFDKNEEK